MTKSVFKKLFLGLMLATALVGSANASYTECTMLNDIQALDRPDGSAIPRWPSLKTGDKVAIQDTYPLSARKSGVVKPIQYYDWVFIQHWTDDQSQRQQWGWVPANALGNCEPMDGTP